MKKHLGALCTVALLAVWLPNLYAQGSQPAQPVDPTAQAPATPAPATPLTFPTSEAKAQRVCLGTPPDNVALVRPVLLSLTVDFS